MPVTHDVDLAVAEVESLAGRPGIKGVMVPTMWHGFPAYGSDHYDRFWAACADADLVVHTHSGEADFRNYGDNVAMYISEVPFWTHRILWQLLFSGKFDKYPNLRYAVVECGSYWVGDLLWKADVNFGASFKVKKMGSRMKGLISRLPSEYFGENVFIGASTMSREEVRRRHVNGIDALMWGTDYPHPEGSWPNTRERLRTDFQDATVEDTRRLLGLNAIISVMIIGGALPQPEVFGVHAVIQAASLLTAWGLTVGNSPVAMSTLIVGNLTDTPSMTVGLVWNRMYTVWAYLFASLVFGLAVAFTPV